MTELEFHPVASIFPMMSAEEFDGLKADIAANGLREPIYTHDGKIVDGRNRYRACLEVGVAPHFKAWNAQGSLVEFVVSLNLHRRHLNPTQRGTIGLAARTYVEAEARERMRLSPGRPKGDGKGEATLPQVIEPERAPQSRDTLGAMVGVSGRLMGDIEAVALAAPDLIPKMQSGELTSAEAKREIRKRNETTQRERAVASIAQEFDYGGVLEARSVDAITLPANSIDMIFTDPPYHDEYVGLYDRLGEVAARVLKPGAYCMAYVGKMFLPDVLRALSRHLEYVWVMCVWQPDNNSKIARHNLFEAWRPILVFRKPGNTARREWVPDAINSVRSKSHHPWQQSEQAPESFIGAYTYPGETVLDPFCGGGTTAVVCRRIGRNFITYDIEPDAISLAKARIQEATK